MDAEFLDALVHNLSDEQIAGFVRSTPGLRDELLRAMVLRGAGLRSELDPEPSRSNGKASTARAVPRATKRVGGRRSNGARGGARKPSEEDADKKGPARRQARLEAALAALNKAGKKGLSGPEVAEATGLDVKVSTPYLKQLREEGRAKSTGSRAATRWYAAD